MFLTSTRILICVEKGGFKLPEGHFVRTIFSNIPYINKLQSQHSYKQIDLMTLEVFPGHYMHYWML